MKAGARYYDPTIGRWIQKDPILSGVNWWVYCENEPVNGVDYSGKVPTPGDWLIAIGWIGVALSFIPQPINWAVLIPSIVAIIGGGIIEHYYDEKFIEILKELFLVGIFSWIDIMEGWTEPEQKPRAPFLPRPIPPPCPIPYPNFVVRPTSWYPPMWQ